RQGGLRGLPWLPVCRWLLVRKLHRQRLLLGADQSHARRLLPGFRGRQHGDGDRRRFVRIWPFPLLILGGGQQAAFINQIVTIAKILPILTFIVILIFAFKADLFSANFWGGAGMPQASLFDQVRATMLVTVFVFLGIEGASVYSRYAQKRAHVG